MWHGENGAAPGATEIYLCIEGGGTMRATQRTVQVRPGCVVVHPPGEVHEYTNGPHRTVLFRVRYGQDRSSRHYPRDPACDPAEDPTAGPAEERADERQNDG